MESCKVKVNNEAESKEVQELLFSIGRTHDDGSKDHYQFCFGKYPHFINCEDEYISSSRTGYLSYDEITLPELRAMVKPMKEYLEKHPDGTYSLVLRGDLCKESDILIPEGAEVATICRNYIIFWKDEKYSFSVSEENKWCYKSCDDSRYFSLGEYMNEYGDTSIIWQREQDEPFHTPETTLNDQYAEIEEVRQAIREEAQAASGIDATLAERQSQYGCYEDVAQVTQEILKALRVGGYDRMPAPHKEAIHMIASKMARIVNGDFNHLDSWHDIGGYSKLIEKLIKGE